MIQKNVGLFEHLEPNYQVQVLSIFKEGRK